MKRRHAKKHLWGSRRTANPAAAPDKDVLELKQLVGDIVLKLSRMSHTHGEQMNFHSREGYTNHRIYRSPARVEAEALYHLVQLGRDSVENVRELIAVPPKFEAEVRDLSYPNSADQRKLLATLRFRRQVLVEFESLVVKDQEPVPVAAAVGAGSS